MTQGPVVVFGATTEPGSELCRLLSASGQSVVAIAMGQGDISTLAPLDVEIRTADPSHPSAVKGAVADLPASGTFVSFVSQDGANAVIDAARGAGAGRFVLVTPIGSGESRKALSFFKRLTRRKKLKQATRAEVHLRGSKLAWTILRSGILRGRKPSGNAIVVENPLAGGAINAQDLARVVYDALDNKKTVGGVFSVLDAQHAKARDGAPVVAAEL